jgi:hypothetical protein
MKKLSAKTLFKKLEALEGSADKGLGWAGRCYEMACTMVREKLVEGKAVYGNWTGPVKKGTMFAGRPVVHHGWVLLPDGRVCDPTRWAFEGKKPYIYIGPADHYDEGGNKFREKQIGDAPEWDATEPLHNINHTIMDSKTWGFVEDILGLNEICDEDYLPGDVTERQLWWLAHLPPARLGEHAPAIYVALDKLGKKALIPIDNRRMVEDGRGYA